MANISKFVSSFKTEVSRPNNFDVFIPIVGDRNTGFIDPTLTFLKSKTQLELRCEATELPGRTFAMAEQKTYGPVQRFPIQNAFDNIQLTFICSDDMSEKLFFDRWLDYISETKRNPNGRGNFDFKYKDEYSVDIIVSQKDLQGNKSYEVQLIEAFPFAVNPIGLSWRDIDNYNRLSVNFNFRYSVILFAKNTPVF